MGQSMQRAQLSAEEEQEHMSTQAADPVHMAERATGHWKGARHSLLLAARGRQAGAFGTVGVYYSL